MKKIILKLLIGMALVIGACDMTHAQKLIFPTNVRYIAGGYIAKQPYYPTLEKALNNVKAFATVANPYVFWLDSDTLQISDWDSVFTASGLTMKDSIDIYYVNTGKIKWAGFGFGGEGSSSTGTISIQDVTTLNYSYPNWDQDNLAFAVWIRNMGIALDSVDQHIWDLIVYTSECLYIENDTLKINYSCLSDSIQVEAGLIIDSTRLERIDVNSIVYANRTVQGIIELSGSGRLRLPSTSDLAGNPREIWGNSDHLFYGSDAGNTADTTAFRSWTRGQYLNISYTDSSSKGGQVFFVDTDTSVTVTRAGIDTASVIMVTPVTFGDSEVLSVILSNGSFSIRRAAAGRANLKVNWVWVRSKF